jgi:hypothetical protein
MTTPNERAERERVRKRAARQGFKLGDGPNELNRYQLSNEKTCMTFQDLAEVSAELRARAA